MPELFHIPDVDLPRFERPKIDLPEAVAKLEWPKLGLPSIDVGKAVADAAAVAHIRHRAQRPRWPLAVGGLIVVSVTGWAILSNQALRARLEGGAGTIRKRIAAMRSNLNDQPEVDRDDSIAFDAAETAPIQTSQFSNARTVDAIAYPAGLGSNNGNGVPGLEEIGSPA